MPKIVSRGSHPNLLDKACLKKTKLKALRYDVWFIVLHRIDRGLLNLTIEVSSKIQSATLTKSLTAIINNLEGVLCGGVSRTLKAFCSSIARKFELIAQRWDNNSTERWMCDLSFHRFLAVIRINNPMYSDPNFHLNYMENQIPWT
jgi:hypothetical protein